MQPGAQFHGIRDYREVMPGVLYRGGANNGRAPLNRAELDALCDAGIGTAIYLYNTQFPGPSTIHCSKGSLDYIYRGWEGRGRAAVHQQIYNAIKQKSPPVFIHCWNGIHATGAVAGPTEDFQGNIRLGFTFTTSIDRTAFGVAWNAKLPSGGNALADQVELTIELEFIRAS